MRPYNHAGGPSIDLSVEQRLKRLDPYLFVTWSPWALDPFTGQVLECKGAVDPMTGGEVLPGPVLSPEFHLWRRDENSTKVRWVSSYQSFGHAEVLKLERDLARFMSPSEVLRRLLEAREHYLKRERCRFEDRHSQIRKANSKRIGDLVFEGKSGLRTRKIVSYPGQVNRGTPTEEFLADSEEDGWEGLNPQ